VVRTGNLPDPDILAREIVEDPEAALEQFREIAADGMQGRPGEKGGNGHLTDNLTYT